MWVDRFIFEGGHFFSNGNPQIRGQFPYLWWVVERVSPTAGCCSYCPHCVTPQADRYYPLLFQVKSYRWPTHWYSSGYPTRGLVFSGQLLNWLASVSILWLSDTACSICNFCLSTACSICNFYFRRTAHTTVSADLSLRYTSMLW